MGLYGVGPWNVLWFAEMGHWSSLSTSCVLEIAGIPIHLLSVVTPWDLDTSLVDRKVLYCTVSFIKNTQINKS